MDRRAMRWALALAATAVLLAAPVARADLIGYWNFDDNVEDHSGNFNHGTLVDATYSTDVPAAIGMGKSLNFDGTDDRVTAAGLAGHKDAFTVSWWLKPTETHDWNQQVTGGGWNEFTFHSTGGQAVYAGVVQDGNWNSRFTPSQLGGGTVTVGSWQHFAFAYDNRRAQGEAWFYKDGTLLAHKTNMDGPDPWTGFNFGIGGGNTIHGWGDEVAVWDSPLPASQVSALAAGTSPLAVTEAPLPTPGPLPGALVGEDIGTSGGSSGSLPGGQILIKGDGSDIWGGGDHFHYVHQSQAGDFIAAARLLDQSRTDNWSKAGIMARDGTAGNAINVMTRATPNNGIGIQWRDSTGGGSASSNFGGDPNSSQAPYWVLLERSGSNFSARWALDYYGQPLVWSAPITHTSGSMPATAEVGLAVTSHRNGTLSPVLFDNVNLSTYTMPPAPTAVPAPWTNEDIGPPDIAGSAQYNPPTDTFHVTGDGDDIWGSHDEFHYVHQPSSGDFSAVALVFSQQNTNGWAKAGLMARESNADDSQHVNVSATPGNGVTLQWRDSNGGGSGWPNTRIPGSPNTTAGPVWVYLSRRGDTFTARWAYDNGGQPGFWQTTQSHNNSMPAAVMLGMHVTSHNAGALSTTVFGEVELGNWEAQSSLSVAQGGGQVTGQAFGVDRDAGTIVPFGPAHWKVETFTPTSTAGLRTEWFNNQNFSGSPIVDPFISNEIDWTSGNYPPETGWSGNHNGFSVRYTGMFYADHAGTYSFEEHVDDEAWLWVDGTQVIHDTVWNSDATGSIDLSEGWHLIEFRSREGGGGDYARLRWDPTGGTAFSVMDTAGALFRDGWIVSLLDEGYYNVGDLLSMGNFGNAILPGAIPYTVRLTVDFFGESQVITDVFMGVPEPGTLSLLAMGGLGALVRRRRKRT